MSKKIKTGFIIANILFIVTLLSSHAIAGVSLFEKKNVIDYRIPLVITIINYILCCSLVLSTIFYSRVRLAVSRFQDRIILTFGIYAVLSIILKLDSVKKDNLFLYYLISLVLFGMLNFILFYLTKLNRR